MKITPAIAALVVATNLMWPQTASTQVADLDLDRFSGRWYEIARNPNRFQRDCTRLSVDFTGQDQPGRYRVVHTCVRRADGNQETLTANARVTDANAKFRMSLAGIPSFGGLASQSYWVWHRAPDYSWAIMGLPDKSHFWIWSRRENPSADVRLAALARARALGFDTSEVISTPG
ncbi:MAG: lipocalin family protein [Brevundimonas sp.]|uniref:lipocalin family protein n=1 Tax=Brevundimonas sp. TaxID=1871086 RepID=UPI00391B16E9